MNTIAQIITNRDQMSPLFVAFFVNFIWINASEVFRYFIFVMPMMRESFPSLPDVAPMNIPVFMIWGIWDTILVATATLLPWMAMKLFGARPLHFVAYGTGVWFSVFVILWLGLYNMNLATIDLLFVALPLAWLEMVVAALIVFWFTARREVHA